MSKSASHVGLSRCGRAAVAFAVAVTLMGPGFARAAPASETESPSPPPWELFVGLGFGNAVCDNEKPDSDCPVDGAFTMALGGGWRFHDHFSVGGELALWAFKIRDEWRGGLDNPAVDVSFTSVYLAPYLRWYWFDKSAAAPYLQAGVGIGSVAAEASNDGGTYKYSASGVVFPVAIGVDWRLGGRFRLGPQAQAYLQVSSEICADEPGTDKECHSPGTDEDGEREGLLLPWRIMLVGSMTL